MFMLSCPRPHFTVHSMRYSLVCCGATSGHSWVPSFRRMSQPCSRSFLTTKLCTEPSCACSPPKCDVILTTILPPGLTVMTGFFSPPTLNVLSLSAITSITRGLSGAGVPGSALIAINRITRITAPGIFFINTVAPFAFGLLSTIGINYRSHLFWIFGVLFGGGSGSGVVLKVLQDRQGFFFLQIGPYAHSRVHCRRLPR